jgi:hypothetical protein
MSITRLQRPRLVVVGNGMAGMRTVEGTPPSLSLSHVHCSHGTGRRCRSLDPLDLKATTSRVSLTAIKLLPPCPNPLPSLEMRIGFTALTSTKPDFTNHASPRIIARAYVGLWSTHAAHKPSRQMVCSLSGS